MEFLTILAFAAFIFVLGIVLAFVAVHVTRSFNRGRGAIVVAAFFLPFLFVGYLLTAGYLRNEFHYDRREASDIDGSCTLPFSNGYNLIFFDEMPSASSIGKGDWQKQVPAVLSRVQKIAITDRAAFGQTGTSDLPDGSVNFFFALNLSTGEIKKFADEAALRRYAPQAPPLSDPDQAFRIAENQERSVFFWPVVAGLPFALLGGSLHLIRRAQIQSRHWNNPMSALNLK